MMRSQPEKTNGKEVQKEQSETTEKDEKNAKNEIETTSKDAKENAKAKLKMLRNTLTTSIAEACKPGPGSHEQEKEPKFGKNVLRSSTNRTKSRGIYR